MLSKVFFQAMSAAAFTAIVGVNSASAATTGIKITEWMYNPTSTTSSPGEFVEFTNFGPTAIDFTGWSFDDNSRAPGSESLSAFGLVQSGESVIFTEGNAATFRAAWGLSSSVKVIGGNANNLGRSDEINLYNTSNTLVDRLTFDDQGTGSVKGPRTAGVSGNPNSLSVIGTNTASAWSLSSIGDAQGSYASIAVGSFTGGDIGNPGKTSYAPSAVPLPAALPLFISAIGLMGGITRRRKLISV